MPRRIYLLGVAIVLVAAGFLGTDAALWRPGPTEANARRIKVGMRLEEVEAILGGPGWCYGAGGTVSNFCSHHRWDGPTGVVYVSLYSRLANDTPGIVHTPAEVGSVRFERAPGPTMLHRLRTLLGL
jgi:hypothetical protein